MDAGEVKSKDFIKIRALKPVPKLPWEIRIDMDGNVFIDGESYDEENSKYPLLSVDVQKQTKTNTGEETQKIVEISKEVKRGQRVTIKDVKGPDRSESTIVKF